MKILEVRDGFIKFEADKNIQLSSFIKIDSIAKSYIAQVIKKKADIGYAKILFLYNNGLVDYDKTMPSNDSGIQEFTAEILKNSFNYEKPVIAGKTLNDVNIVIDGSAFNKKTLISIDSKNINNTIVQNLTKQFNNINKNVVILDTLGTINAKKYVPGIDFKLPLNTSSLEFLYKECLSDATEDSKSLIIEIFRDLAEYSQSVQFVPFDALKSIIDNMVDKSHVFKLIVLKNKLAKLDKLNLFANKIEEVVSLKQIIKSKCAVIDLTKLDSVFQNKFISYICENLDETNQTVIELSNVINKSNLKIILTDEKLSTTIITHSNFKYLNDIKNIFDNFIIEPSIKNNLIFSIYKTFLEGMQKNTLLLVGEAFNYIPLVSIVKPINETIEFIDNTNEQTDEIDRNLTDDKSGTETNNRSSNNKENEDNIYKEDEVAEEEINDEDLSEDISDMCEEEDKEKDEINNSDAYADNQLISDIQVHSDKAIEKAISDITVPENINMFDNDDTELDEIAENVSGSDRIFSNQDKGSIEEITIEENSTNNGEEIENSSIVEDDSIQELGLEEPEIKSTDDVLIDNNDGSILNENQQPLDKTIDNLDEQNIEDIAETASDITIEKEHLNIQSDETLSLENSSIELNEFVDEDTANNSDILVNNEEEIAEENSEIHFEEDNIEELPATDIVDNSFDEFNEYTVGEGVSVNNKENDLSEEDDTIEISLDENNNLMPDIMELQNNNFEAMDVLKTDEDSTDVIPLNEDENDFDEIVELNPDEVDDNTILVDMGEEELPKNVDDMVTKDVDKVFSTVPEEQISDNDLDFIDELNSDSNNQLEEVNEDTLLEALEGNDEQNEILEEYAPENNEEQNNALEEESGAEILETRNSSTPIVPVYDAEIPEEDIVVSDPIQQGDNVLHAKYGYGVVEKMIKYGNKTLFSINFDNVGRRLLDPTLTELKKN